MLLKKMGVAIALSLLLTACTSTSNESVEVSSSDNDLLPPSMNSSHWATWVDEKVQTTDGEGHGPDVGSAEWCGVVDFRLFNRKSGETPCSDAWKEKVTDVLLKEALSKKQ